MTSSWIRNTIKNADIRLLCCSIGKLNVFLFQNLCYNYQIKQQIALANLETKCYEQPIPQNANEGGILYAFYRNMHLSSQATKD